MCVQVEHVKNGYSWESVMCHGLFQEVTESEEKHDIELMLADQYAALSLQQGEVPVSPVLEDLHRQGVDMVKKSVVYRIDMKQTTGVKEKPDPLDL